MAEITPADLRLIAFFLPQYHPTPENDQWWGRGFTEWTNATKAKPLFPGHYQPHLPADLGFYDLRLAETRQAQADLAREHGLHGFCYYHYWFHGKRLLDRPFQAVLESGKPDFPFCLCWSNENWTRIWDGLDQQILQSQNYSFEDDLDHIRFLLRVFRDERYIKIDGRPLFLIYRVSKLPNSLRTTTIWREEARRAGFKDLYLCRVEGLAPDRGDPVPLGFDAAVEFQPDWSCMGDPLRHRRYKAFEDNHVELYDDFVKKALQKPPVPYRRYPCLVTGWDNTPRRVKQAFILDQSTPASYERWLRTVVERFRPFGPEENLVFINAWNEWGEGAHLEPCRKWGRAYLEATRRVSEGLAPEPGPSRPRPAKNPAGLAEEAGLSVCLPVYNGEKYLQEALESVLGQTWSDFELVIADDASTDRSWEIITSFSDGRIRAFRNEARLGLVGNWNKCLELARGDFVSLFHQDDLMLPQNLERKAAVLREHPRVGLVYSDVCVVNGGGEVCERRWFAPTDPAEDFVKDGVDFFQMLFPGPNLICCPSVLVRRECFEELGGFDERLPFAADWEMWLRIAANYDVGYLAEPLLHYRCHDKNETLNFVNHPRELEQYFLARKIVAERWQDRIPEVNRLLDEVTWDIAEKALDRAFKRYRDRQVIETREYLSLALNALLSSNDDFGSKRCIDWLLDLFATARHGRMNPDALIWHGDVEAESCGAAERRVLIGWLDEARSSGYNLLDPQVSGHISFRDLMAVIYHKLSAKRWLGWIKYLKPIGKKILG